jgi:hypothetical protein
MDCQFNHAAATLLTVVSSLVCADDDGAANKPKSPPRNLSRLIEQGGMPHRVHVFEDFETDIEKRWWLRGKVQSDLVPPSQSMSFPNLRACRSGDTLNFDRKMSDQTKTVRGVIFNPVPGPPMGPRTRLSFRYRLEDTDTLKVQIYSLSNNYHRYLLLTGLPQDEWRSATVNMRDARRPDGSGGPLSEDERIDDIQFYVAPDANVSIDDIVLYDAVETPGKEPFPRRVIFTGWFDTGKQGNEWPGDFEIVLHKPPNTWDAAKSVAYPRTGKPFIRVGMRGERTLSQRTHLRFRYRLTGSGPVRIQVANGKNGWAVSRSLVDLITGSWAETAVTFDAPADKDGKFPTADEVRFFADDATELLIDDVLLFEPGGDPD